MPTIYDILGITRPRVVNGIPQDRIDGVSFTYSFDDPHAAEQHHIVGVALPVDGGYTER